MKIPKPPIDAAFLKSSLGLLKIFQMGWSLIAFILSDVRKHSEWGSISVRQEWDAYEAMSAFLFFSTLMLWVIFLASWHEVGPLSGINWLGLILAALCCFKFTLTSRQSYRKWHSLRPTPVIPYQDYQYSRLDQAEEDL
uniref:MARVEL domain-containing protein n=1 Tax=Branchiostoma floridae TaxID=7739 RepID=C3XUH8_BRAFL|eukprot:XP_002612543.1 hypothetical protein BRAFLDRAFT_120969 [Branchiostoma floridae]